MLKAAAIAVVVMNFGGAAWMLLRAWREASEDPPS